MQPLIEKAKNEIKMNNNNHSLIVYQTEVTYEITLRVHSMYDDFFFNFFISEAYSHRLVRLQMYDDYINYKLLSWSHVHVSLPVLHRPSTGRTNNWNATYSIQAEESVTWCQSDKSCANCHHLAIMQRDRERKKNGNQHHALRQPAIIAYSVDAMMDDFADAVAKSSSIRQTPRPDTVR